VSRTGRRVLLYTAGLVLAAGGVWLKYGYEVAPDPGVRLNGAALIAGLGQYDEALGICETVLEEHPDNVEARIYKATFLAAAGRLDEALGAYDDALAHVGEDAEMRRNLRQDRAGVLLSLGRMNDFRAEREKLAAAAMDHRVHVLDGMAASRGGDHAAAVEAFAQAHALVPEDNHVKARLWQALMDRGEAALADRRFDEAKAAFDTACPLFEKATNAHLKAAEVRLATGEVDAAATILRDLGPGTPGAAPLLFRVATVRLRAHEVDRAVDALEAAFQVDPKATRVLLEKEETWASYRENPRVRALLTHKSTEAGTPGLTRAG
jgi:tetratricopeptide (TPR) repeat protein